MTLHSGPTTEATDGAWSVRRVGDLVRLTNGYPFESDSFGPDGDLPLVRIRDLLADDYATYVSGSIPPSVVLRDGDIVIGMDGDFETVLWRRGPAALNQRLCLLRPLDGVDARFIAYALPAHLRVINDLTYATTVKHLSSFDVLAVRLPIPEHVQQRAIADYLDAETTRIDRAIESLRLANDLLRERLAAAIESIVWRDLDPVVPLMRLTQDDRQIQYGIVLPGPDVDDGVPIVKGGNLLTGVLRATGLARTARDIEAGYARSRLRVDDIAFAIRGAVGACALVPKEVEGANITQDVAMIAPSGDVDPVWLLHVLRSPSVQGQAEARILGATIRGINIRDLKRLKVPMIGPARQREKAREIQRLQLEHDSLVSARARQAELLLERRQALITAAVAGQAGVPGVAA